MKKQILFLAIFLLLIGNTFAQTIWSSYQTIDSAPGENPYVIASGLINNDAYPDLIVGTYVGDKVLLYLNNGDGTFASSVEVATLNEVNFITVADMDGINGNDIVVSSYGDGKVVWYANNGAGVFSPTENLVSNTVPGAGSIFVGLIDGDAFLDVAISAYGGNKVVWYSND